VHPLELRTGDVYLLCSDGLYEPLGPERIAAGLALEDTSLACANLVTGAYEAGGRDNITAVVVRIAEA
jgi:serine/threonine protein phosphatase PrpC